MRGILRWAFSKRTGVWTERLDIPCKEKPKERNEPGEISVTFISHSTVLLQQDGLNILTDPVYSNRVGPLSWLGIKRYRAPGICFLDLPPIDIVLISHDHYDHLDLPTLYDLEKVHQPLFVVGLGNAEWLRERGLTHVVELDWWQGLRLGDWIEIVGVPAQHWSKRGLGDTRERLWVGFVMRGSHAQVYFAGDTGFGPHFEEIYEKFGPMRLALLPMGAYRPQWFMSYNHMNPREAVDAQLILRAQTSVGIHFGTFPLGGEGQDDPQKAVQAYLDLIPEPPQFIALDFGERLDLEIATDDRAKRDQQPSP